MPDDLISIASYEKPLQAHEARGRLAAAGIPSQVSGESAVSALAYVGTALGGVKLLVWKSDVERAAALLLSDGSEDDDRPEHARKPWKCPRCRERNEPAFDLCWSCGAEFAGHIDDEEDEPDPELEAIITRAWRAAILGTVMCPVGLQFYSMWLLVCASSLGREFDPVSNRWFLATLIVDVVFFVMIGLVIWLAFLAG